MIQYKTGNFFGNENEVFTNCVVLTGDAQPCPNEIYQGFAGYCREHWFKRIGSSDDPKRLQGWNQYQNCIQQCENCNLTIPIRVLAEHQADCIGKTK